ncbi:MAG: hypothetical protein HY908_36100 [Myxococcales bacterium]|nr:hypothetical protein [Myxococcales bacterium]
MTLVQRERAGTLVALVGAGAAALCTGCWNSGDYECPTSPCPEPFSVLNWCANTHACHIDGGDATFPLAQNHVFEVPFAQFSAGLAGVDLQVIPHWTASTPPWSALDLPSTALDFALDDILGTHWSWSAPTRSVVRWDPFPANATMLTFAFHEDALLQGLSLYFIDYVCELENPRPDCAL